MAFKSLHSLPRIASIVCTSTCMGMVLMALMVTTCSFFARLLYSLAFASSAGKSYLQNSRYASFPFTRSFSGDARRFCGHREVRAYLEPLIESQCNANVARYQTIKRFKVLPVEFSVEGGELTPTMKIKRNVVHKKYAGEIEALYE